MLESFFIPEAFAQQATSQAGGSSSPFSFLILIVGMFLISYFLLILPQRKVEKKRQEMIASLEKGKEVVTQSGIYGKIVGIAEKVVTLEIAPNVKIKVAKHMVASLAGEEKAA